MRPPDSGRAGRGGARPLARLALSLVLLSAVAACSGSRSVPSPFDDRGGASQQLRVFVDNQNFNDLRLYALTTRGPQPLGQVGGRSTASFRLDWPQLDGIRFRMEFLASRSYETIQISAGPGDRIEILIGRDPSNTIVRRR